MQKGFIFPSLYIYLGLGAVIAFLYLRNSYLEVKVDLAESRYETFVDDVAKLGNEAKLKAKQVDQENKLKKEKADEDLRKLRSLNNELSKRVRDNSRSSFVPPTGPATGKPETACFDQQSIDGAIKRFTERVTGIVEQGQEAITDLNNAKQWATTQQP